MGWIVNMIFAGIAWTVLTIIQAFIGYIDICDAALTTFIIMVVMHMEYGWSNWAGMALGLAVSLVIYIIFKHYIGFWVVSVFYSAFWGWILVEVARLFWFKDMSDIWYWIWIAIVTAVSLRFHNAAYWRKEAEAELAAEEAAKARR